VYLLAADSRRASPRVYWVLPMLVLWGNLHGTASLGAGLTVGRGFTLAWQRRHRLRRELVEWRRPLALVLGAPICLLLTPYGLHTLSYYHATLFNNTLRDAVTEWQPITSEALVAWPFFVLAGVTVWSLGRSPRASTMWDGLALVALAAVSISVIRNVAFFSLCALALVPPVLDGSIPGRLRRDVQIRPRLNAIALGATLAAVIIAAVATLTRPQSKFELSYQRTAVLDAVRSTTRANPAVRVLTDVRFADWLLWRDPSLRGRLANDIRFELLTRHQIDRLTHVFAVLGVDWKRGARGYRLIVLDRRVTPDAAKGFQTEPGSRVLYNDGTRMVILRSVREADA
jgi:hypothetical protein